MTLGSQTKTTDPIVFIGGCPRSGTTLLQRMLDHHPRLAIANDTHFVPRSLEIVDKQLLAKASAGQEIRLTEAIVASVWNYHRFYRLGIERDKFEAAVERSDTYRQFVAELFAIFTRGRGKRLGGEKTPDYVRCVPMLLGLFPDTQFIHIVRDGRNVALSLRQWATAEKGPGRFAYWDTDPLAVSALWWRQFVEQSPAPAHFANRYYVINYEQLVAEPTETMQETCSFLDLEFALSMVRFHEGKQAAGNSRSAKSQWLPATSGLRDWRRDMSPTDVAVFEALAGDALVACGYELSGYGCDEETAKRANRAQQWWNEPGRKRRPKPSSTISGKRKDPGHSVGVTPSHDDDEVISSDPQLDNLASLLVNERFRDLVRLADCRTPDRIHDIHAVYVRYKRGTNCLVSYAYGDGTPLGYAVTYGPDGNDKIQKAAELLQAFGGDHGFVDAARRIAFYRFPCDPLLPQLLDIAEGDARSGALRSLLPVDAVSQEYSLSWLSFKPRRRCIAMIESDGAPWGVLRMYLPTDYLRARQAAKYLPTGSWNKGRQLGHSDRHHALLISWVAGSTIDVARDFPALANKIGQVLGEIHGEPHPKFPLFEMPARIHALHNSVLAVMDLVPSLRDRALRLGQHVSNALAKLPHHLTLCHGDFHAGQILRQQGTVSAVDWDNAINTSPGFDLGTFAAHAYCETIQSGRPPDTMTESLTEMIDSYRETRQLSITALSDEAVNVFVAHGLLAIATRPFRYRHANWRAHTEQLIALAEQRVGIRDAHAQLSAPRDATPFPTEPPISCVTTPDVDVRWLRPALSPSDVSATVIPLLRTCFQAQDLQLADIKILGHKPHRRCTAQYSVRVISNGRSERRFVVAKIRKKGLDLVAADVQRRLHDVVQAKRGLQVAAPLGTFAEWGMWLQTKLDGHSAEELTQPNSDPALSRRIGRALAELHEINLTVNREHSFDTEYSILQNALRRAARKQKSLTLRIDNIRMRCRKLLSSEDRSLWTGIHRDFYPAQVLCTTDRVGIVDLDLCTRGHRAVDLGNYVAHLKELALRRHDSPQALAAHEVAFITGYQECAGGVDQPIIDALTVVSLARHIYISRRIPERRKTTAPLVALCEQLLDQHHNHNS